MKRKIDWKSALTALGATLGAVAIALWVVPGLGHRLKPQLSTALWEIIAFGTCAFGLLVYQGVKYFLGGGENKKTSVPASKEKGDKTISTGLVAGLVTVITACLTVSATLYTVQRNDEQQAQVLKESQDELVQTQKSQQENADLERITDMNTRFTVAVDHLASSSAATRAMGVSELAMLADDWSAFPRLDEGGIKQATAIDALVSYLKTPFELTADSISDNLAGPYGQEMSVRSLISTTLHDRLDAGWGGLCESIATIPPAPGVDSKHYNAPSTGEYYNYPFAPAGIEPIQISTTETSTTDDELPLPYKQCWATHKFDFTGANFYMADFSDAYFVQPVNFSHAHFYGYTYFIRAVFLFQASFWEAQYYSAGWNGTELAGYTSFARAVFKGGADFFGTVFGHSPGTGTGGLDVDFIGTNFDADSRFVNSEFKGAVSFDFAQFSKDYPESSTPVADFTGMAVGTECQQDCVTGPDAELTNITFHHGALIKSADGQQLVLEGSIFYGTSTLDQYNWCVANSYDGDDDLCSYTYQHIIMESGAQITYSFDMDKMTCSLDAGQRRPVGLNPC